MKDQTYSQAIRELENILNDLESGEMPIDELEKAVERAVQLLEFCHQQLYRIDESVKRSLQKLEKIVSTPLTSASADEDDWAEDPDDGKESDESDTGEKG